MPPAFILVQFYCRLFTIRPAQNVMIFTLYIEKSEAGIYCARILNSGTEIAKLEGSTILEIIQKSAAYTGTGLYGFQISFGQVALGTESIDVMRRDAVTLAQRLESLAARSARSYAHADEVVPARSIHQCGGEPDRETPVVCRPTAGAVDFGVAKTLALIAAKISIGLGAVFEGDSLSKNR